MVVISVYTYGVKIIKKFRWESGFLWGVPWNPPLCTNGSAGYLMQLSVKKNHFEHIWWFLLRVVDSKVLTREIKFNSEYCFSDKKARWLM